MRRNMIINRCNLHRIQLFHRSSSTIYLGHTSLSPQLWLKHLRPFKQRTQPLCSLVSSSSRGISPVSARFLELSPNNVFHRRSISTSLKLWSPALPSPKSSQAPNDDWVNPTSPNTKNESFESNNESIEETYSRKTPLEHILLRPSMYVGPTERLPPVPCWVLAQDVSQAAKRKVRKSPSVKKGSKENKDTRWNMQRKEVSSVPALLKIFDEILVNASDNRLRHPGSCTRIDVIIHRGGKGGKHPLEGDMNAINTDNEFSLPSYNQQLIASNLPFISVTNNGKSIPIQIHQKENMYLPELLFGHLLTGSNFNDGQRRVTGGRHGYGAKLTNVFSKEFIVEIRDGRSGPKGSYKVYRQRWENNMSVCHDAEVEVKEIGARKAATSAKDDFTRITFVPDLPRLTGNPKTSILPEEEFLLMRRRVVDIAGCSDGKLTVTLNGEVIGVSGFEDYSNLHRRIPLMEEGSGNDEIERPPMVYQKLNSRWEVAVGLSDTKSFESISFVNGMNTSRGGTHVDALARQISRHIAEHINTKMTRQLDPLLQSQHPINVTSHIVRRHLFLCVNSLIENPSFDSQMKECLTTNPDNFGSNYELPNSFLNKLMKPLHNPDESGSKKGGPGIVEEVIRFALGTQQINIANMLKEVGGKNKSKRQVLSIPKLEDANLAGSTFGKGNDREVNPCTLILTEGDSAKALAVAGLEVIGRDKYGVFPLRGKFLNVRSVSVKQLANNAELKALCTILGLQFDKSYETMEERTELRYGHVMLMTDQDADGSHIKGLIMNLFRHFWPALLKPPIESDRSSEAGRKIEYGPFLSMFVTPLLKATKKGKRQESMSFFSMAEYNAWRESLENDEIRKWSIKYYKGLGTSTQAEAKEYFNAFVDHFRPFRWQSEKEDGERIDMAFDKDRAGDRKDWILREYDEKSTVTVDENDGNSITYGDFVDNELIHFSNANNIRSLPHVVDGLKPSQRKVLFACFKRNLKNEIKVAQLAGYCAEHTAYHHGEASLHSTIVGMAQDFVGSNNINLLTPSGQFGTRLMGGSDAASPRYIFTHLSPLARLIFPEADDLLLNYREEDGQMIEPEYFCPIIPMLLVNGSQGIGTGWSTFIPQHNPCDVLNYIRAKLDGKKRSPICPWVKGFNGTFRNDEERGAYITEGVIEPISSSSVVISELPIGTWTNDYKDNLVKMLSNGDIQSFSQNHTTTTVSFDIKMNSAKLKRLLSADIHKSFKLRNALSTRNMHAFSESSIVKFDSPEDIADVFFPIRMDLYADRKSVLESSMGYSATLMRNKARFIEAVSDGNVDLLYGKKSKEATINRLQELKFLQQSELDEIKLNNTVAKRRSINNLAINEYREDEDQQNDANKEFDYLLNMPLSSLTSEKISTLQEESSKLDSKLKEIKNKTPSDLWKEDLDNLEPVLLKMTYQ